MALSTSPLSSSFVEQLSKVSRKMRTAFDARVSEHGLTFARARALMQLSQRSCLSQSELADALDLERATVVRLIDGMARQDLVERRPVAGDRRANGIALTDHGRRQASLVVGIAAELRGVFLDRLSEAELKASLELLTIVGENIEAAGAGNDDAR